MALGPQTSPDLSLAVPRLGPGAMSLKSQHSPAVARSAPKLTWRDEPPEPRPSGETRRVAFARPKPLPWPAPSPAPAPEPMTPADWSGSLRRAPRTAPRARPGGSPVRSRALRDLAQHLGLEPEERPARPRRRTERRSPAKVPEGQGERRLWKVEMLQPSAEPSAVPVEASDASDSLLDYAYHWPSEQEPLGPVIRSLEFQVNALFELMEAHSLEAESSVLEVIERKREAVHETFQCLKEAVWWSRRRPRPHRLGPEPERCRSGTGSVSAGLVGGLSRTMGPKLAQSFAPGDTSGLSELEALQSQLEARISQVQEADGLEPPKWANTTQLEVPSEQRDMERRWASSGEGRGTWLQELQASWAAGACAARPVPAEQRPVPKKAEVKPEVTLEPLAVSATQRDVGLVLTPTYFHFRSDD